jgi:hypothetical protein
LSLWWAGGKFEVTEDKRGLHLAECGSCSEDIWVGHDVFKKIDGSEVSQK